MEATRTLREEHDIILRGLDVLSAMATAAEGGEPPDPSDAAAIISFIRDFADAAHHHKEEGMLFPTMGRFGMPTEAGPIAVMLGEHEQGRRLIDQAASALDVPEPGAEAARAFARPASEFVALLRQHINKENQILFNMAEQVIDEAGTAELDAAFAAAVTEQTDVRKKHVAALEALEARYTKAA